MNAEFIYLWRRGRPKQRVRASDITVTTSVNQVGQLSANIPAKDLALYGLGSSLLGLLCQWNHVYAESFAGEVTDESPSSTGRTLSIVATSPANILASRVLPATYLPVMATGPALIAAAIAATSTRRHLPITDLQITEFGRPITGEARADDLFQYVQSIASASGCEWIDGVNTDGTYYLQVGPRVGSDKRHKVWLIVDANCVDATEPGSLRTVKNVIVAVGDDRPYAAAAKTVVTNPNSLTQPWGRREGTIRYTGVTSEAGLEPLASADVERLGVPPIEVTIRMSALNPLVKEIRRGDTIRLSSGTAGREYAFRPMTVSTTDQGRILTLTGPAEIVPETVGAYGLLGSFILGESLLS